MFIYHFLQSPCFPFARLQQVAWALKSQQGAGVLSSLLSGFGQTLAGAGQLANGVANTVTAVKSSAADLLSDTIHQTIENTVGQIPTGMGHLPTNLRCKRNNDLCKAKRPKNKKKKQPAPSSPTPPRYVTPYKPSSTNTVEKTSVTTHKTTTTTTTSTTTTTTVEETQTIGTHHNSTTITYTVSITNKHINIPFKLQFADGAAAKTLSRKMASHSGSWPRRGNRKGYAPAQKTARPEARHHPHRHVTKGNAQEKQRWPGNARCPRSARGSTDMKMIPCPKSRCRYPQPRQTSPYHHHVRTRCRTVQEAWTNRSAAALNYQAKLSGQQKRLSKGPHQQEL